VRSRAACGSGLLRSERRTSSASVCRQRDCWGEKHVSGIRSVLAQQGSADCTLRSDLRGIAKAALLRSPFKGGAPFSRKSLLRSVGLTSRSAGNMLLLRYNSVCHQSGAEDVFRFFVFALAQEIVEALFVLPPVFAIVKGASAVSFRRSRLFVGKRPERPETTRKRRTGTLWP
jgi:hypothetical protein